MNNLIGDNIRNRRKKLKLTQMDIVSLTHGLSSGQISEIEKGGRLPSLPVFIQLIQALQCSADEILGISPNSEKCDTLHLTERENILLNNFRILSYQDQEDILDFIDIKARRTEALKAVPKERGKSTTSTISEESATIEKMA